MGVPQGSSFCPLLFLLYVNDFFNAVQSIPLLFDDDTCLLLSHPNPINLQKKKKKLNQEVSLLYNWCNSNKLALISQKFHVLIIPPKINSIVMDFLVMLNNSPLT